MKHPHSRMCLSGVMMTIHNFKGFKPPKKPQKGAWLGTFQPNWQNHKIAISPTAKIGSTPNFSRLIPHSWLRGWSRMENSNARCRTAAILENVGNAITRPPMDRFARSLGGHIPSYPRHVRHDVITMATALNIQQLWASGGRTREPILIKFGTQQKITSMTVKWSNIKIFKIQNGGRPPC